MPSKNKGFALIPLLIFVVLGLAAWFLIKSEVLKTFPNNIYRTQETETKADTDPKNGFNTFTSKYEGFTLTYPDSWFIKDTSDGNCGHKKVNGSNCRERFDLTSADGLIVRYVEHSDYPNSDWSCGPPQSVCNIDTVRELTPIEITNFGEVLLVKTEKNDLTYPPSGFVYNRASSMYLHKPESSRAVPKLGENIFGDYAIDYSLPSRLGGRYAIWVTSTSAAEDYFAKLSPNEFFNLQSVKEAEEIMKSLSY